ncbi:6791_t:CDS:2, partial [Rhizophagus irregularis]
TGNMPCHWLVKGTKEYCTRPTKNQYCGKHAFTLREGSTPPKPCKNCGNGTNSALQICIPCGQYRKDTRCNLQDKVAMIPPSEQQNAQQPAQQSAPQSSAQVVVQEGALPKRKHHRTYKPKYGVFEYNEPPAGDIEFTECRTERRLNINGEVLPEDIYQNVEKRSREEEKLVDVSDIMSCWQAVVPSMRNPSYNFNKEIAEDDYGKTPYMVQMIEASHEKITEVIQTEFERKGSQLKARITAYCAYEQRKIVQGEISVTYTDKYHDRETQVLLAEHSINEFLDRSAGVMIDADIEAYLNNGSGWKLLQIEMIYIEFYKYERALGGSWKETPKGLSNKKVTINPNNRATEDNLCLGYTLGLHFLHYENDGIVKNPQNLSKIRPYISRINLEGIPMPTPICPRVFEKIEKQNPEISVNV